MSPKFAVWIAFLFFSLGLGKSTQAEQAAPVFKQEVLESMIATVRLGIHEDHFPGAVVWFEHENQPFHFALGQRSLVPTTAPMEKDTIFDVASLTKVVATTPAVLWLIENGLIDLEAPVSRYLPRFVGEGKEHITVRQLLTHTSGMRAGISRLPDWTGYETGMQRIYEDTPESKPDTRFRYSDINFILLGELVRAVSGKPLDEFVHEKVFAPLKMTQSFFCPDEALRGRIAPTTVEAHGVVQGSVHDPTSRRMDGVTGHAGLFTTAADLARYAKMLLNKGELDGVRVFRPETVQLMTSVQSPEHLSDKRGLGWDIDSGFSHPRGSYFREGSYGHTGWTGPSLWIDPASRSFVIFLTNRNHPTEAGQTKEVRIRLTDLAAESIESLDHRPETPASVFNGVDVIELREFRELRGKRVGLITNHTGLNRKGKSTIDLFHESDQVDLKCLFGPEHGIRGESEEKVDDATDPKTQLPIYSLYGENRQPTSEQLADLDALVFDVQDIGCRFYTYISTMGMAMEAAAEAGIQFIVLDRINPINAQTIDGPVRDGESSFTAYHDIPIRHGMTVGELALMFQDERGLDLDLRIIPMQGWRRQFHQDDTDLSWTDPSPNIRNLDAAILYPGIGLLEFMKLSVGRGTASPFELVGAPFIDGEWLAKSLNALDLPGITIKPTEFIPDASVFKGETCQGIRITLKDRSTYSINTGLAIASLLQERYPEKLNYARFATLLVHPATFDAVKKGRWEESEETWIPARTLFEERRLRYLLY